jgi:hypothetical protein
MRLTHVQETTKPSERAPKCEQVKRNSADLEAESRLATTAVMRLFLRRREALFGASPPRLPT